MDSVQILLEKRRKVNFDEILGGSKPVGRYTSLLEAATVVKNFESLGFTVSQSFLYRLAEYNKVDVDKFYRRVWPVLKKMVGAHVKQSPMYPNFPRQVMEESVLELFLNAIVHYWSDGNLFPLYIKEDRKPLDEKRELKVLETGSFSDFFEIFTQLVGANTSLSASDKEIVEWFIANYKDSIHLHLPTSIPQKENLALVVGEFVKNKMNLDVFIGKVKTATDLLRIAVQLSDGDISLAQNTKFKKFNRPLRRFFLANLNNINNADVDMARYEGQWIRLGEILHPGEYSKQYPKAAQAFKLVRDGKAKTVNGWIENAIKQRKGILSLGEIAIYPGDYARRIQHLYKVFNQADVNRQFEKIIDKVSTPVLLTLQSHFENFGYGFPVRRLFFPKGSIAKAYVTENTLSRPSWDTTFALLTMIDKELKNRFGKLSKLGKVYVDPELANYFLPTAQRSASKTLNTITRGTKLPLPDKDTVRFFLWWKDDPKTYRTDIDLSAKIFDGNWKHLSDCGFYNLRGSGFTHSGDIVQAPKGAAEFIDIDIPTVVKGGARYVVMMMHSYSGQKYSDLPECFGGFMGREAPQSGEVFEPSTVVQKFDISSATQVVVPAIFDLVQRKFIWADLSIKSRDAFQTARGKTGSTAAKICEAVVEMWRPNLYNLLETHAEARGTVVDSPEDADVVWSVENGFQMNFDLINSEFVK